MQEHTFHKVHGHAYASTMCIGNLRCASEALSEYLHSHDRRSFEAARTYFGVILVFAVGAGLANAQTGNIVLLSAALLRAAAGELRADVRARRARELSFLSKKSRNVHKTFLDFSFFLLII